MEIDLAKFNGRYEALLDAVRIVARANYRQTCVNLDDGILQRSNHELNEFLRLMGVGITGIVRWEHLGDARKLKGLKKVAGKGMVSMADELNLPYAKAVTTVKPSGTMAKIMDTTEGVHKPLGRFIFNNVGFSKHDPIVEQCRQAGYKVMENPYDDTSVLVTFPVEYKDVKFEKVEKDGQILEVNLETAIDQLERYRWLMDNYVEHNCSITVSYSPDEIPAIIDWLHENWDSYVAVSFLYRNDPTKTAADLGYLYIPQEVVTEEVFRAYEASLKPLNISGSTEEIIGEGCSTGACPIR